MNDGSILNYESPDLPTTLNKRLLSQGTNGRNSSVDALSGGSSSLSSLHTLPRSLSVVNLNKEHLQTTTANDQSSSRDSPRFFGTILSHQSNNQGHNLSSILRTNTPIQYGSFQSSLASLKHLEKLSDGSRIRLVEQFYNTNKETPKLSLSQDLFQSSQGHKASRSYSESSWANLGTRTSLGDPYTPCPTGDMAEILTKGGLTFTLFLNYTDDDEALVDFLLDIECASQQRTVDSMVNIAKSVAESVTYQFRQTFSSPNVSAVHSPEALEQLDILSSYLKDILDGTQEILLRLQANKINLHDKYKTSINQNYNLLKEVLDTFKSLDEKMTSIKVKLKADKEILQGTVLEKISLLEKINERVVEHSRRSRDKRLKQLSLFVFILVLLASIVVTLH